MKSIGSLLVVLSLFSGCSSAGRPTKVSEADARPARKGLTEVEAARRARLVRKVDYELSVSLDAAAPDFIGVSTLNLELSPTGEPLTIDFTGGTVDGVTLDGAALPEAAYNGFFVTIPAAKLTAGKHAVAIRYHHPYGTSGVGLHRFRDPEDGRSYLYTHFEPYDANLLFPCLDQPDLKATYKLTVEAPADWAVVSSTRERNVTKNGARATWDFPRTLPFSTYVFSLHAGHYKMWEERAGDIPMRLFVRQSFARYVIVKDWMTVTRQGLRFYGGYFGRKYPFGKYDQVIIPESNSGAMENVGAVTFNERYVKRGRPTRNERESLASVILHEMAHMWFGDLVTMKWWNGLWLNESFATYMSTLAQHEATEFKEAWLEFSVGIKAWAYGEDQLVTTHPIDMPVTDTETAFANFDGITYGKGASTLKQLAHHLGERQFRDGVRFYLKSHAFANATLGDFFGALEQASGKTLGPWSEQWLHTAGLNSVQASFRCSHGRIASFALEQSAPAENPTLRTHATQLALLRATKSGLAPTRSVAVTYSGARTEVPSLVGAACPAFVYPNGGDYDFIKVKLDPVSLETARRQVPQLADPLTRAMTWQSLWRMVVDGQWPVTSYADTLFGAIDRERVFKIAASLISTVGESGQMRPSVFNYLPGAGENGEALGAKWSKRAEEKFRHALESAVPGSDFQKLWFDALVSVSRTAPALRQLESWLADQASLKGLELDQDRRWAIVKRLSLWGEPGAPGLIDRELARDPSDQGQNAALAARAAAPGLENKTRWLEQLKQEPPSLSLARQKQIMGALVPRNQMELRARLGDELLSTLVSLSKKRDGQFLHFYAAALTPSVCTLESVAKIGSFLDAHADLPVYVVRPLRVSRQEDERCVRARK